METTFNFSGLKNIYNESLRKKETMIVFNLKQGCGVFNFLMFFSDEDVTSKDKLFLYLGNTNVFTDLKMYGSHRNGTFTVYISEEKKRRIIKELNLEKHDNTFDFFKFLNNLNDNIPQELAYDKSIQRFREVWPSVRKYVPDIVYEPEKTILIGIRRLPQDWQPKEKTLRKLYLFTNSDSKTISTLITELTIRGMTVAWTDDESKRGKGIKDIFLELR